MKMERLIGILTTLQQKGKTTTPYLAEKYEVSRRTINRDIETLCRAGIPIVTSQGIHGGVSIMDGFQLDTTLFTEKELQSIFIGLQSLDSVSDSSAISIIAEKIGGKKLSASHSASTETKNPIEANRSIETDLSMEIDLASFYKSSLSKKIALLKSAISDSKYVTFHYYYEKGEEMKKIEPYKIIYKWSDWYIFGYCTARQDFRLYKLSRLWELQITERTFSPREIPSEKLTLGRNMTDDIMITAIYEPKSAYRLVEEYGPDSFTRQKDGNLYTEWGFSSYSKALQWFLSFGSKVEILSPDDFREIYLDELQKILKKYKET